MSESLEKISNFLLDKKKESLKYNKQEIPDKLKYNSDDEESFLSKDKPEINLNDINNNNLNEKEQLKDNNKSSDNKANKNNSDKKEKEEKGKNAYELLLLKKIKNIEEEADDKKENIEIKKEENKDKGKNDKELNNNNIKNENEEIKYSSKTFSRNIEIKKNKDDNNNLQEKKNFLNLLSLIKNKMIEKEKIYKEKESILKRAKSQESDKERNNNKKEKLIYNKKKRKGNTNKSLNIKTINNIIENKDEIKRNKIKNSFYKHHIPNKSMDINYKTKNINKKENKLLNNIKQNQIQNENKKIINNYYFSNSNYNFNNFFQNNLSPKSSNKIYKKKYLTLKENNYDYINSFTKSNNTNDNSSENNGSNYKTNIENYDSSPNYSSMNSNRNNSRKKINLKVNKKSYFIGNNISYIKSKYEVRTTKNNKMVYYKNTSPKRNYFIKDVYGKKKKWNLFKIEDLLVIEEKILSLLENIKINKEIFKQCFDIMNYFYNSSLYKKLENIFNENNYISNTKLSIKYLLFSLIIIYEYSFNKNIYIRTKNDLIELIEDNYNNLYLLKLQIINDIARNKYDKEDDNSWIKYLLKDINNINTKINLNIDNTLLIIQNLNQNNEKINSELLNVLNYFPISENNLILNNFLFQLKTKSYDDINNFMQKNILKIENAEGSLIASLYLRNNSLFFPINPPYIKSPLINKKYTLVLDLDETLVNFKIKTGREGFVRLRPFLFGFLEEVIQYYELIIFTSATEAYANSVIEAIEQDKKYFDFVFYRQHTIIIGNDFVKDLTRIGRPLNSTIIVDNMPQNFRFQKENGIVIKPFYGQDSNDKTLYNLIPILIDIAKMGGDVRINLNKFKDDIISKITSNI